VVYMSAAAKAARLVYSRDSEGGVVPAGSPYPKHMFSQYADAHHDHFLNISLHMFSFQSITCEICGSGDAE
jgi:hypothetical protein